MNTRVIFILACFLFLSNCVGLKNSLDEFVFKMPTASNNYEKKAKYVLSIPKRGVIEKSDTQDHALEEESIISYSNGAKIYVTNKYMYGSQLNVKNRVEGGFGSCHREQLFDTILVHGINNDSLFWKEKILGDIVVGYLDVPKSSVSRFDDSLNTLRKIK